MDNDFCPKRNLTTRERPVERNKIKDSIFYEIRCLLFLFELIRTFTYQDPITMHSLPGGIIPKEISLETCVFQSTKHLETSLKPFRNGGFLKGVLCLVKSLLLRGLFIISSFQTTGPELIGTLEHYTRKEGRVKRGFRISCELKKPLFFNTFLWSNTS
jgi:hypothetical protein